MTDEKKKKNGKVKGEIELSVKSIPIIIFCIIIAALLAKIRLYLMFLKPNFFIIL
jgi:hypothetical protein